jgi:predicted AlkP superfamily phosphohydrolase/phosphomutase
MIGLDCVPPKLAFERFYARMPNLAALARCGSWGSLRSCVPPITVPAWASMLTGRDAGELGLYGFRNRPNHDYALRTAHSGDIRHPWLWQRLQAAGKSVAALFVPPTYPVAQTDNGTTLVSCMLTPGADRPHTLPASLAADLTRRFGAYIPDLPDVRHADRSMVLNQLFAMTEQHFAIAAHVYKAQQPDFMVMVEIGPDRLHHAFWQSFDIEHPRHDPDDPFRNAGQDYYAFLDARLGELLSLLDQDTTVLVVSDHGARPLQGGICVNEWLIEHGYLVLEHAPDRPTPPSELAIDWRRTRAWAEGGYYARVCLNVQGREPLGAIPSARFAIEREGLLALLAALPGPRGEHLPHRLLDPRTCFRAQNGNPPDILAFLGDLDYRAIASVGSGRVHVSGNDTGPDGCTHDWDGIFVMGGGGTAPRGLVADYQLHDVYRTVLGLLDVPCEVEALGVDRSRA